MKRLKTTAQRFQDVGVNTIHPDLLQTWGQLLELAQELARELVQEVDMNHLLTHQKVVDNSLVVRQEESKGGK